MPALLALFEPVPLLPKSASAKTFVERMQFVAAVTETTPWSFAHAQSARSGWFKFVVGCAVLSAGEVVVLPIRLLVHVLMWLPFRLVGNG